MNEPFWKYKVPVKFIYLDHIIIDGKIIQLKDYHASIEAYRDWIYNAGIDDDSYETYMIDSTWHGFVFHNANDAVLFKMVWG